MTAAGAPAESPAEFPDGLEPYRKTELFTEASLPAGLLNDHCTKAGVWGLVHVAKGRLRYCVTDPRRTPSETILSPETAPGLVEPTILHHVVPLGAVAFHVQFYRQRKDEAPAQPQR